MRMRIGLVVTGGVDRSGRERVVPTLLWLIERLARRHDVHVFALHYYPEPCTYPLLGAMVHDVGRVEGPPGLRRFRLRSRLASALRTHGPFDVLHAYGGMPAGFVAAQAGRQAGVPVVVTFDSGEFVACDDIQYGLQRRWIDRRAIADTIQAAARVTVATDYMARLAAAHGAQATVVPLGIDTHAFLPAASHRDHVGPPWRLLRVASLNRVKDYQTLLQALGQIVDRGVDVHLDIVGEDTLGGAVQALGHTLRLDSRVTFLGFQPTDQVAAIYRRAHLHVASSRHEAAGVVMLEAASTGLATVGTAVGYVADWSPERAVAVPVHDPDALAHAIVDLLHDAPRRERIASAAREWTLAHDADWTARQFEGIYTELHGPTKVSSTKVSSTKSEVRSTRFDSS
jgi:glycosyltransferase involved in cell wall biosynthesis